MILQQFAAIGVKNDVLTGTKESDRCGQVRYGPDRECRIQKADRGDRDHQRYLRCEHPASAASKKRQCVPIHDRRPQKLPGIWHLYEREEADLRESNAFGAQPSRHELNQDVER